MKIIILIMAFIPLAVYSKKYSVPAITGEVTLDKQVPYFSPEPTYNQNETRALELNEKLLEERLPSQEAESGGIEFVYGQGMPVVVCSPLRLCDIALQVGENVKDVMIGDPRWKVQPSISGTMPSHQIHAIVKPSDVGLETSLMISTDRRVYNVTLKSSGENYMPRVSFTYPGSDSTRSWDRFIEEQLAHADNLQVSKAVAQQNIKEESISNGPPRLGVDVDDLNFSYSIKGNYEWKPTRIFDDGIHTYVDLPDVALSGDVPVLVVSPFDKQNEIVNYRLRNNRYVIDGITSHISLIRGVGREQQIVKINRN